MWYYFGLFDLQSLYNLVTQLKFHYTVKEATTLFSNNIIGEQNVDFLNLFFTKETYPYALWEQRINKCMQQTMG